MTLSMADPDQAPVSWALKFTLGDWESRASVRSSTHDYQLPDDVPLQLQTRHWFPPAFLPYLAHPAIQAAGACLGDSRTEIRRRMVSGNAAPLQGLALNLQASPWHLPPLRLFGQRSDEPPPTVERL